MVVAVAGHWLSVRDGDPRALALYLRHYSAPRRPRMMRRYGNGARFAGPGQHIVLLTACCDALCVWRKERYRRDDQTGVNCAVFRNEGPIRSSVLIRETCDLAWQRWPGERLFTFVDPRQVRSTHPGACFKHAGWSTCGVSKTKGLVSLECRPEWVEERA